MRLGRNYHVYILIIIYSQDAHRLQQGDILHWTSKIRLWVYYIEMNSNPSTHFNNHSLAYTSQSSVALPLRCHF